MRVAGTVAGHNCMARSDTVKAPTQGESCHCLVRGLASPDVVVYVRDDQFELAAKALVL
jgi:hypothetical protein